MHANSQFVSVVSEQFRYHCRYHTIHIVWYTCYNIHICIYMQIHVYTCRYMYIVCMCMVLIGPHVVHMYAVMRFCGGLVSTHVVLFIVCVCVCVCVRESE